MEADERVDALHHEADSDTEEGMEFRVKGFSPRALRQDFTIEAVLSRLWKARRTMAVANSDASSLLGGWSFRKDNLSRSLSHFVSLWDGDPTSIDRRNPEAPEIFFYQRRLTALIMGQVNVVEDLLFSQAAGNGFTARCLASMVLERAVSENRILITMDKDFGELIHLHGRPHTGLIRLPEVRMAQRITLVEDLILNHRQALDEGAIITVTSGRIPISRQQLR